jgi:GAF domain-containing protein
MVAQPNWGAWRPIERIREVATLTRSFSWTRTESELAPGVPERFVRRARDAGEALLFAMHAAIQTTCASVGLVHRVREPFVGLVTSCARGPGAMDQLGQVVPQTDPALEWARLGEIFLGSIDDGAPDPVMSAIRRRLSTRAGVLAGVAMVPVFDGGRLLAMIEVGREGHSFRSEDASALKKIADVVCER